MRAVSAKYSKLYSNDGEKTSTKKMARVIDSSKLEFYRHQTNQKFDSVQGKFDSVQSNRLWGMNIQTLHDFL